ncbi:uncharacterized protein [Argopecten irradians]|uniref:uncharacterized protein n=1 Tax=Argopecten irradians TaxID=31199 RepID=UPI003722468B
MKCIKHPDSPVTAVCVTCGTTLVCVECVTDELHSGHVFRKPNKVAADIKTQLKPKIADNRKLVVSLESGVSQMQKLKSKQENEQKERVKLVNKQREMLLQAVNKTADNIISEFEAKTKGNCATLEKAIDDIPAKIEKVRQHEKDLKRIIGEKDNVVVVVDSQKLEDLDGYRNPLPELDTIEYTPGKVNTVQLQNMFRITEVDGSISLKRAESVTSMSQSAHKGSDFVGSLIRQGRKLFLDSVFQHSKSDKPTTMCLGAGGKAWIRCIQERRINLTDRRGRIEKTVNFDSPIFSMNTVDDDSVLVCDLRKDIKRVNQSNGKVTSLFSTGRLYPMDACPAPDGDIYVTLVDKVDFNANIHSERVLIRYSPRGQEKSRTRQGRPGEALLIWPGRVRVSGTGDIGVLNQTDGQNSHLILLNKDLTLRLQYLDNGKVVSGNAEMYKQYGNHFLSDFNFDAVGNIIICEVHSSSVQLLSKDCVPMTTVLPAPKSPPWCMCMNEDEIWLGCHDGTVKIYKYE